MHLQSIILELDSLLNHLLYKLNFKKLPELFFIQLCHCSDVLQRKEFEFECWEGPMWVALIVALATIEHFNY